MALLIAAALGAVAWFGLVLPLQAWHIRTMEDAGFEVRRQARLRAIIAKAVSEKKSLAGNQPKHYVDDFLSPGQDAVVLAGLQSRLGQLVKRHRSKVISATALKPDKQGETTYLGVRLQIRGGMADIQRILHSVEAERPLLLVRRAQITPARGGSPEARQDPTLLNVQLDIFGAKWPGRQKLGLEASNARGSAASATETLAGSD